MDQKPSHVCIIHLPIVEVAAKVRAKVGGLTCSGPSLFTKSRAIGRVHVFSAEPTAVAFSRRVGREREDLLFPNINLINLLERCFSG